MLYFISGMFQRNIKKGVFFFLTEKSRLVNSALLRKPRYYEQEILTNKPDSLKITPAITDSKHVMQNTKLCLVLLNLHYVQNTCLSEQIFIILYIKLGLFAFDID